jgi:hypothetical protein
MSDAAAKLVIVEGVAGRAGQEINLTQDVITIGRMLSCQIVIEDDFASRRHAQIVRRDETYWVRDLGSKNGTLLDNRLIKGEAALGDGAEICIGAAKFRFVDPTAGGRSGETSSRGGALQVEVSTRQVWIHGVKLEPALSLKQFELLHHLFSRAGEAVSKDEIVAVVWPETETGVYDYQVDKMVSRVRERIGKEWIETVWGYGYRLRLEP